MELLSAKYFTLEQLTEAYNQTRVDYLVPMPMNVARLREYATTYDIDMGASWVAKNEDMLYGLGMLGVRPDRAWITRLGVLPNGRRKGTGNKIMEALIASADKRNIKDIWLEVIKGNAPAHGLFTKMGFEETRELIIARRAPAQLDDRKLLEQVSWVKTLDHKTAVSYLHTRKRRPNWLNEAETFYNVSNLSGLEVELKDGSKGWVTYYASLLQLKRIIVEVISGDPREVTSVLLQTLHERHKRQDAVTENLLEDEIWQGFQDVGYFDSFRRIEMLRQS